MGISAASHNSMRPSGDIVGSSAASVALESTYLLNNASALSSVYDVASWIIEATKRITSVEMGNEKLISGTMGLTRSLLQIGA